MRPLAIVALLGLGCGRVGFDDRRAPGGDAAGDGPAIIDAPGDAAVAPLTGCAMWLKMDEALWTGTAPGEVADACGGDDNGRAVNGATTILDPVRGQVGVFPAGTSPCVEVPDAPALRAGAAVTMSIWAYPTGLDLSNAFGLIAKRSTTNDEAYDMFVWTGNQVFVDIDTENDRFASTGVMQNDRWTQITTVFEGTLAATQRTRVYVDGVLDSTHVEASAVIPAGTTLVSVGCLPLGGPAQSFAGRLDDAVIWTRARSPAEVAAWYTQSKR
jgi:hypothetical protein